MNRLSRDEILHQALDMVDSPSLDTKDRPNGVVGGDALSVNWLQNGIDFFHHEFPWQGLIRKVTVTLPTTGQVRIPNDFILDVRDGLLVPGRRLRRRGLQELIDAEVSSPGSGEPLVYAYSADSLLLWRVPKNPFTGTLWYYALPPVMEANAIPAFPSDWVLVDFVHLRGKEWLHQVPPGTALTYARGEVVALRKAGLGGEPESSRIPIDEATYRPGGGDRLGWMGETIPK